MDNMAQRVASRWSLEAGADDAVTDPNLKPKKLAARYVRELTKGLGKGAKVELQRASTTLPRSWDYGVFVETKITLPGGDSTKAAFNLNVSQEESSGTAVLDYNFGGVIASVRFAKPEDVIRRLIGDTIEHLKLRCTRSVHPSWKAALASELEQDYFRTLIQFVRSERTKGPVYPPSGQVFRALELTPLEDVRVVVLGQDPYHGHGQAHGLAFSVLPGAFLPPSLVNIYRELWTDVQFHPPGHGCLEGWARQGVLLLNSVLTVRAREPGSHAGQGWERFTDALVRVVATRDRPSVFVLWGRYARDKAQTVDLGRHAVIESAHPSPKSADQGFFGSRPFSRVNQALAGWGRDAVRWQLSPQ